MMRRDALLGVVSAALSAVLCGCASGPVFLRGQVGPPERRADVYQVDVDDADAARDIDRVRAAPREENRRVCLWIDVGRSERLADEHPTWIAGMGSHEDWRRKFPDAPKPGPGERVGVYPWVPIWYREVLENRRDAIYKLLKGRTDGIDAVFLAHVQGAPSACGCGNDQCRWTVDYRMAGGPQRVDGSPAALLIAGLKKDLPGVEWIPVWVTECEESDQPGEGSTGYCGTVGCFNGLCWKESTKEMEALAKEATGRIALVVEAKAFHRGLPRYEPAGSWAAVAVKEVETIPPAHARAGWPANGLIAVVEAAGLSDEAELSIAKSAFETGVKSVLYSHAPLEEGWEPRIIPAVTPTAPAAFEKDAGHEHAGAHEHD